MPKSVLHAQADGSARDLTEMLLADIGLQSVAQTYQPITAEWIRENVKAHQPDLLIVGTRFIDDVKLDSLVPELKTLAPHMKILVWTAASQTHHPAIMATGVDEIVSIPVDIFKFMDLVKKLLEDPNPQGG